MSEPRMSAERAASFAECQSFGCAGCFGLQCLCGFTVRCCKDPAYASHSCVLARTNQLWTILIVVLVIALIIIWRF
jgi:hypothetical protein